MTIYHENLAFPPEATSVLYTNFSLELNHDVVAGLLNPLALQVVGKLVVKGYELAADIDVAMLPD